LQVGMSREQVRFIMGTPIATSAFRNDRWDYYGYYKPPRGEPYSRTVSLFFEGDKLARMEGEKPVKGTASPDVELIEKERQKAAAEKERAKEEKKTEGILAPPDQQEHQDGGSGGTGGGGK
jgi:outer membrane protein assembly factor BamE